MQKDINITKSVLEVHPAESIADVQNDLNLPDGQSIAELINEQEQEKNTDNSKENGQTQG